MGVTWTEDQKKVIELRNRNILVSAAAGSGKTAKIQGDRSRTLLERIAGDVPRRHAGAESRAGFGNRIPARGKGRRFQDAHPARRAGHRKNAPRVRNSPGVRRSL